MIDENNNYERDTSLQLVKFYRAGQKVEKMVDKVKSKNEKQLWDKRLQTYQAIKSQKVTNNYIQEDDDYKVDKKLLQHFSNIFSQEKILNKNNQKINNLSMKDRISYMEDRI